MTTTDLRQMLSTLRPGQVREEAEKLKSEADQLQRQARALAAMADALEGELEGTGAEVPTAHGSNGNGNGNGNPPRPSNKRPMILQVVRERPSPSWSPKEIHSSLIAKNLIDPHTSLDSIRVTLKRMFERDELARDVHGLYKLPAPGERGTLM